MQKPFVIAFALFIGIVFLNFGHASAEPNWTWFYSSEYVSEFCDTDSIKVVKDYSGKIERIEFWLKTTYSDAGVEDTIKAYKLSNVPDIYSLKEKLSKIYIIPKDRKMTWKNEVFYNSNGYCVWSKETPEYLLQWENLEPDSPNERSFSYVVDQVFNQGKPVEFAQWGNSQRWEWVLAYKGKSGNRVDVLFDKNSIMEGGNKIWFWQMNIRHNEEGGNNEEVFREIYDTRNNTVEYIATSYWNREKGWEYRNRAVNLRPSEIILDSIGEKEVKAVENFVNMNREYVNRFCSDKKENEKSNYEVKNSVNGSGKDYMTKFGFSYGPVDNDGYITVKIVEPKSIASKAGLQYGDKIGKVNDVVVSPYSIESCKNIFDTARTVEVSVNRLGVTQTFKVTLVKF